MKADMKAKWLAALRDGEFKQGANAIRTYRDRLVAGLLACGCIVDTDDKSKYTAFKRLGQRTKYFVGVNGALRCGECASRSFSIGDPSNQTSVWLRILKAGEPVTNTAAGWIDGENPSAQSKDGYQ